jgi:DNA-binding MarR family transcriptional regulator
MKRENTVLRRDASELSRYEIAKCVECTAFNLRKAMRAVQNLYDEAFRPAGIKGTQYTVLGHAFSFGPITLSKLADIMVLDRTTLARNLAPLEKKGLIEIKSGSDRRTRYINITDDGKAVLSKALPIWKETQDSIKDKIGEENWSSMISNIKNLVSQIQVD